MQAVEHVGSTHNGAILASRGVMIARFWYGTSVADIELMRSGLSAALRESDRVGVLIVIDEDAKPPDRHARTALGDMLSTFSEQIVAWAGCVSGTGLGASSKRTLMRVVLSLGRIRCPWVIQSNPEDASRWLASELALGPGSHEVKWLESLESVRSPTTTH